MILMLTMAGIVAILALPVIGLVLIALALRSQPLEPPRHSPD